MKNKQIDISGIIAGLFCPLPVSVYRLLHENVNENAVNTVETLTI